MEAARPSEACPATSIRSLFIPMIRGRKMRYCGGAAVHAGQGKGGRLHLSPTEKDPLVFCPHSEFIFRRHMVKTSYLVSKRLIRRLRKPCLLALPGANSLNLEHIMCNPVCLYSFPLWGHGARSGGTSNKRNRQSHFYGSCPRNNQHSHTGYPIDCSVFLGPYHLS